MNPGLRVPRRVRIQQAAIFLLCGSAAAFWIDAVEPGRAGFYGICALGISVCLPWAAELETKYIPDEQLSPLWRRNRRRWRAFKARFQ